jgi:hypothetical protein
VVWHLLRAIVLHYLIFSSQNLSFCITELLIHLFPLVSILFSLLGTFYCGHSSKYGIWTSIALFLSQLCCCTIYAQYTLPILSAWSVLQCIWPCNSHHNHGGVNNFFFNINLLIRNIPLYGVPNLFIHSAADGHWGIYDLTYHE